MYGIIGGSGLEKLAELQHKEAQSIHTPYGDPSEPIQLGELAGQRIAFLSRHGADHLLAPHEINYRANLWALKHIGVTHVIGIAAVGGISKTLAPGALCVADQIIDYTYGRAHTYSVGDKQSVNHIDFTQPYCTALRQQMITAAQQQKIAIQTQGVYGVTQGPRLETAAEIQRIRRDGCDLVGMTGMPEAALARELDLCYANISLVVNWAAGLSEGPITMADITNHLATGMQTMLQLVTACIQDNA